MGPFRCAAAMTREGWDAMARWRDERMGEDGDLWHRALINPTLLDVVGPVQGLRVLDLACGNGYLTRRWAREGAAVSLGVDLSSGSLARARRREAASRTGARFLRRDASDLSGIADRSFDLVVANMALLDIEDASGAVREVARVLDVAGRFVFSVGHPCFDLDDRSAWIVERSRQGDGVFRDQVWRKLRLYREERSVRVPWAISPTEVGYTRSYHRTLSTYSRILRDAGLAVVRIEEPAPTPELVANSPQGPFIAEVPLHLVVEAVALRPAPRRTRPAEPRRRGSRTSARTARTGARRTGAGDRRAGSGSPRRGSTSGS